MENKIISQLVENTGNLILNNQQLVKNNELALQIIEQQYKKTEELTAYLKQEYQALTDKKKRSIQEENQYQFIKKLLLENR